MCLTYDDARGLAERMNEITFFFLWFVVLGMIVFIFDYYWGRDPKKPKRYPGNKPKEKEQDIKHHWERGKEIQDTKKEAVQDTAFRGLGVPNIYIKDGVRHVENGLWPGHAIKIPPEYNTNCWVKHRE